MPLEFLAPQIEPRMPEVVPERPAMIRTSAAAPPAGFDVAILKVALAEERERTTSLRRSLDETRIALAAISDEIEILRRHRDVWAERAKALATALVQEPARTGPVHVVPLAADATGLESMSAVAQAR